MTKNTCLEANKFRKIPKENTALIQFPCQLKRSKMKFSHSISWNVNYSNHEFYLHNIPFVCRRDLITKTGKYTKTETENISKLTAYTNQVMWWELVFYFIVLSFCFYTVFVFFSSYNPLNSVILRLLTIKKYSWARQISVDCLLATIFYIYCVYNI